MKIGLFFGSFNPIHIGHMAIAKYMTEHTDLNQVWFVVTPQSPFKKQKSLLGQHHRLMMTRIATEDCTNIIASNIEFDLPKPSFTINTLTYLNEKYASYNFNLIMGQDNLSTLHKWKNFNLILSNYKIYVYPRSNNKKSKLENHKQINFTKAPLIDISSSLIRNSIKKGKNVSSFLPKDVWTYIDEKNFYK